MNNEIDNNQEMIEYAGRWYIVLGFYPGRGYLCVLDEDGWPKKQMVLLPEDCVD